ncbi:uncharacterized protein WM277_008474 [Molossus nigricans]
MRNVRVIPYIAWAAAGSRAVAAHYYTNRYPAGGRGPLHALTPPSGGQLQLESSLLARPWVRPPPPPSPSTQDRERHPSSIIRLQRSERLAQVTTSLKTEREKERRNNSTNTPAAPLAAIHRSPPAASRRPLLPRRPCRPISAPQDVDLTRGARGGRGAGEEGRLRTRASAANPRSASAPAGHNFTAAGPARSARAGARAHARTDDTQPACRVPPPPPGPSLEPQATEQEGAAARGSHSARSGPAQVSSQLRGASPLRENTAKGAEEEGEREGARGRRVGESAKRSNSRSTRDQKSERRVPAARSEPGMQRWRLTVQGGGRGGRSR